MASLRNLKDWANRLTQEVRAIYLAQKDPRTPWYARLLAACVVGYAFSPIDLIPDPIPVVGYLDDLILIPLGVAIVVKLIPSEVIDECRQKAREAGNERKPKNWAVAGVIVVLWIVIAVLTIRLLLTLFS